MPGFPYNIDIPGIAAPRDPDYNSASYIPTSTLPSARRPELAAPEYGEN